MRFSDFAPSNADTLINQQSTIPALGIQTLGNGSSGPAVVTLQNDLISLGYGSTVGAADGNFGDNTELGVMNFQADQGLDVTGQADNPTWNALQSTPLGSAALPSPGDFTTTTALTGSPTNGVVSAVLKPLVKVASAITPNGTPLSWPLIIGVGVAGLGGVILLIGLFRHKKTTPAPVIV
jgi:peptidoglycan hydrolase-like protein with peptidoglycan-binding domain